MKVNLYAIYDDKADNFTPPFTAPSDAVAFRMFGHSVNSNPIMASYPTHFSCSRLGTFDDSTGQVESAIELIAHGPEVVRGDDS